MAKVYHTSEAREWPDFDGDIIASLIHEHSAHWVRAMNRPGPCFTQDAEVLLFADFTRQWEHVRIALSEYRDVLHRVHGWVGGNLNTTAR